MSIKRICIAGGGVVEMRDNKLFAKAAIVEYLEELTEYFDEVVFVAKLENDNKYLTEIDPKRIDVIHYRYDHRETNIVKFIKYLYGQYRIFSTVLNKDTCVIQTGVNMGMIWRIIVMKIFAAKVVFYLGSDPKLTLNLKNNNLSGLIRKIGITMSFPLAAIICNALIVRGKAVFEQARKWNKKIIVSNPIISYKKMIMENRAENTMNGFNLLFVGKINKNKGVYLLIDAFQKVNNELGQKVTLTIVGIGEDYEDIKSLVIKRKLNEHIRMTGYVDDIDVLAKLYQTASILIVPTLYHEGFPRVIDEAMIFGVPVICSRLGGMSTDMNNDDVIFIEPGDENDLVVSIKRMFEDSDLYRLMSERSFERSMRLLKTQTAAKQHAEFILHEV